METGCVVVCTTLSAKASVEMFAETLVAERLAACVNVFAEMESVYRWKGAIERDRERQVLIKTTAERLPALEARLRALHPYEVPELLVLPVIGGSERYLAWLRDSTRP